MVQVKYADNILLYDSVNKYNIFFRITLLLLQVKNF